MSKRVKAAELSLALEDLLGEGLSLQVNNVGNLAIFRGDKYIGWIDFGDHAEVNWASWEEERRAKGAEVEEAEIKGTLWKSKRDGEIYEEVGAHGDKLWLIREGDDVPLTHFRKNLDPYTPPPREVEIGDVWTSSLFRNEYRCIGVDEKRKLAHWVKADKFHNGNYPVPRSGMVPSFPYVEVYTRSIPEMSFTFTRKQEN